MKRALLKIFIYILPQMTSLNLSAATQRNVGPKSSEGPVEPALPSFDYEFGRPIEVGEHTYSWYRKNHADEASKRLGFDAAAVADGMDTWHWWVGVDNPGFWRDMAKLSGSHLNKTNLKIDVMRMLLITPRNERFKKLGLINDPDCVAAIKPNQFGLTLDKMKDGTLTWDPEKFGYSSGVIGLQIFKNEKFDSKKWSLAKYMDEPSSVEPPYKVGMSCAFCHIGFNPLKTPVNPEEPKWENLTSAIGNQYLREGLVFGQEIPSSSFIYQYLATQEPGTSETSRFPMDFINNPTVINSIFRLADRLKLARPERITVEQKNLIVSMYKNAGVPLDSPIGALGGTDKEPTLAVPHILTDGSDSMGVLTASVRVYVNEGMMHDQWYQSWPLNPFHITDSLKRDFAPRDFDVISKHRKNPNSPWMQTERRMPNMATFLESYDSFPLSDAEGGKSFLSTDKKLLDRGKVVFADNCARCHSSKQPENLPSDPAGQVEAWRKLVSKGDFLEHNYLSDDQRHMATELGTNIQRAEGTNALAGSTWGQMSSQTYKDLKAQPMVISDYDASGKAIPLYNPLTGQHDIMWKGSSAFYRTPTLVGIWATAPFLHNNSLGDYVADPSVANRVARYQDAMTKMLWPEKRLGINSIKVTTEDTSLPELFPEMVRTMKFLNGLTLKLIYIPKGTPVNLIMNLNPKHFPVLIEAYIQGVLSGEPRHKFKGFVNSRRSAGMASMMKKMLELNTVPDFIEDRGHIFGSKLSDDDKKALIEYAKYF
ncbi:MAG: hypothetical protein H7249_02230 [Chitinophagaceae bacterium]|nr:hypothetical protein [Oligoflexus sp.]